MTPQVILKYVGEGESARIVHAEQDGKTGYFQVVPEYDWVNDDPVWKSEHLEWLAAELEPALGQQRLYLVLVAVRSYPPG